GAGPPARPAGGPPEAAATTPPWRLAPSALPASAGSAPWGAPFFGHPVQAGRHRRQPLVPLQPRGLQRRAAVVAEGTAHRITVTPDRLGFGIGASPPPPFEDADATHPPFQFLLCGALRPPHPPGRPPPVV